MVDRSKWRPNYKKKKFSEIITVSDEAFAILVMENNMSDWIEEARPRPKDAEPFKKGSLCRYTKPAKKSKRKGRGGKLSNINRGWSIEGRERYNKIYDFVKAQRESPQVAKKEKKMMEDWQENDDEDDEEGSERMTEEEIKLKEREEAYVPRIGFYD